MNIFNYIKKYGNYSFKERKFNEIDNVILSSLTYINFNDIVQNSFSNKLTIKEAAEMYFNLYGMKIDKNSIHALKIAVEILKIIMNTKRYKDILMHNYQYMSSDKFQFGAISFDIDKDLVYIGFEGTDHLISGWIEDFMISCTYPVAAQKLSIKYLNRYLFNRKKIIIGGHSKGGHLSIISSMYSNYFVKRRILKIYSNDGLGIREKEYNSKKYKNIKDKIIKLVPEYSVVGHLLKSEVNMKTIKSTKKGLSSHHIDTWIINNNKFSRGKVSKFSKVLEKSIDKWLLEYTNDEKIKFIEVINNVCKNNQIETLYNIKGKKRLLIKEILDSTDTDIKVKEMFKKLYQIIKECNKNYKNEV